MLEQLTRSYYQRWFVDPVVVRVNQNISPNHVTTLAGIFGILIIPALLVHQTWFAIFLLFLSGYLDTLDGTLARYLGKNSSFGCALDIVIDRVVEFAVILALWAVDPYSRSFLCLMMLGSVLLCVSTFLVVGIFIPNASAKAFHYSPGIMERAEAFIFFILMILFPSHFQLLSCLFTGLVFLTAIIRLWQFYQATLVFTL